jgi:hypothetical protein
MTVPPHRDRAARASSAVVLARRGTGTQSSPSTGAPTSGNVIFAIEPVACRKCGAYSPVLTKLLAVIPASTTWKTHRLRLRPNLARRATVYCFVCWVPPLFGPKIADGRSYGDGRTCGWYGPGIAALRVLDGETGERFLETEMTTAARPVCKARPEAVGPPDPAETV